MNTILPSHPKQIEPGNIEKVTLSDSIALGTTSGLETKDNKNLTNEDRVGCLVDQETIRICVVDGHWGDGAADKVVRYWIDRDRPFPDNREAAISATERLEEELHEAYQQEAYDKTTMAERDKTPEAAFVVAEIGNKVLRLVSYGDCRLLVARHEGRSIKPFYVHSQIGTWLGALSRAGLRSRLSVAEAIEYKKLPLQSDDIVIAYTDGVDECQYEVSSIGNTQLAAHASSLSPSAILDAIMEDVYEHGAQDHASLAIVRVAD